MAVTHHQSSRTIRGITYNYGQSFTCYAKSQGTGDSEGGGGTSLAINAGETCYYYGYATGDSGGLTSHPFLIYDSLKNARGWHTESIFPYAKYTISYNANGGSGAPSSQTKTYGTALTLSSTKPIRNGYTFSKWNTNSGGTGTSYNAGASYTTNSGATLYAQWTPVTYNITIDCNGGSGVSSTTYTIETANFTLGTPTRTGYTFLGWTGSNGSTEQKTVTISKGSTGNKTYTANWSENKLTVNYYSNYATYAAFKGEEVNAISSNNILVHSQDFLYDNTAGSGLADVQNIDYVYISRIGYTPTGKWGTSISGGTLIDQSTTYSTGQALAQAFGKSLESGNASVNIYPQWQINSYTINYNANGGYNTMSSQTVDWNSDFALLNNLFKREGYKFIGWNAHRDKDDTWYVIGQGWLTEDEINTNGYEKKVYENQTELTFNNSWVSGDEYSISEYTLYAVWEISGVVYIDNGISFEPYLAYIDNGTDWELYLMYVDDGENWNIIS